MKQAIKQWIDPITVPREICRIRDQSLEAGIGRTQLCVRHHYKLLAKPAILCI